MRPAELRHEGETRRRLLSASPARNRMLVWWLHAQDEEPERVLLAASRHGTEQ